MSKDEKNINNIENEINSWNQQMIENSGKQEEERVILIPDITRKTNKNEEKYIPKNQADINKNRDKDIPQGRRKTNKNKQKHPTEKGKNKKKSDIKNSSRKKSSINDSNIKSSNIKNSNKKESNINDSNKKNSNKKKSKKTFIFLSPFLFLACVYLAGFFYFSGHMLPKSVMNGKACGKETFEDVKKQLDREVDDYTIILKRESLDDIPLENSRYSFVKNKVSEDDIKALQNKYRPLWFYHWFTEFKYDLNEVTTDEDSLKKAVADQKPLHPDKPKKAKNAKLQYNQNSRQYDILKEQVGNMLVDDTVISELKEAVTNREDSFILEDRYFEQPKYTTTSEKLLKAKSVLDKYLSAVIHYKTGDKEFVVDANTIHEFLCWDKDFKYRISKKMVSEYVRSVIMPKFSTVGEKKTVKTKNSGKVTVSGGTFGYQVGPMTETKHLLADIKAGNQITRDPEYYYNPGNPENEIGETYIDVNISKQKLYLVKHGKTALSSPIVTGNISTGHPTPTGLYKVEFKQRNHTMVKYNSFVRYWMPFETGEGVGFHDADWRSSFGGSIYKTNGSHGCVNMPPSKAADLYNSISAGIPVVVHY